MEVAISGKTMDSDEFERLLAGLNPDRDRAGEAYEKLRSRLTTFFWHEGCPDAEVERLADRTFDVVARQLNEGLVIRTDLHTYALGIARRKASEWHKTAKIRPTFSVEAALDEPTGLNYADRQGVRIQDRQVFGKWDDDPVEKLYRSKSSGCLEECKKRLPMEQQRIWREYYRCDDGPEIDYKQTVANELGITKDALKLRVHRIRIKLEECVLACVQKSSS
jgi:DNA-directed RNA polymerase specialized sigma24 family protein